MLSLHQFLTVVLAIYCGYCYATESILRENVVVFRLPNHTHPESYDLTLSTRIDLGDFDFNGVVKMKILVDSTTREIVLHGSEMNVKRIRLARYSGSVPIDIRLLPHQYDEVREFIIIATDGITLTPGDRLLLEILYHGTFRTDNTGFFRKFYVDSQQNETKWIASTMFEATHARHAFPCYDEPALKAKFKLQITHGKQYHALSNMPEVRFENSDDTATTAFAESPLMSTYLVAFLVSNYSKLANKNATFSVTRFSINLMRGINQSN